MIQADIRRFLSCCGAWLGVLPLLAQLGQAQMDSLRAIADDPRQPDSVRIEARYDLGWKGFLYSDLDSAVHHADLLLRFSEKAGSASGRVWGYRLKGTALGFRGDRMEAIAALEEGLRVAEDHRLEDLRSYLHSSLGINNLEAGNYPKAIEYLMRALKDCETKRDSACVAGTWNNIGYAYYDTGDTAQALNCFLKAVRIYEEAGLEHRAHNALNAVGGIHLDRAELDEALAYYERAHAICEAREDPRCLAMTHTNMAIVHRDRGAYAEAEAHLEKADRFARELGDRSTIVTNLMIWAEMDNRRGRLPASLEKTRKAYALAAELGIQHLRQQAAERLYRNLKERGSLAEALTYHEIAIALRDSMASEENQRAVLRQQYQYDFDKKEALLAADQEKKDAVAREQLRRRELQRNVSFGGAGLLALVAVIIFFQRNRIRSERDRSEELLLNILPYETAQELKAKGSSEARLIEQVTVLFTDFKGFTGIAERLSPAELVAEINTCFSAFDRIMEKHGVEKIKTIGDAYMAAGGLPTPNRTHATDVVAAALEMRDFMDRRRSEPSVKAPFEIRIGVHTGPVVAGIVGIKKFQYDIWGDTVNLAARMESSGEVGEVNISAATHQLVKDHFDCTPRGSVEAKGKGPLEMWFVKEIVST